MRSPSSMRPIVAALAVAAFALPAFGPAVLPTAADAAQQGDIY
ncbi:MAG: hypothetical protein ACJA2H_000440, partial [Nitriliruptoraceae bacterium]